ncbi:sigma-70 family RNA polymerase sigma factor [Saccharospirillum sp. HFRX-1]|uniref:sigma-70 family RNA polymerase sigma factor n=1 Tax=unclassified Saccharospirillum TaxID=2633430 RepID=UPI0037238115
MDALSRSGVATLYQQHQPWLYSWLCRRLGCEFDAADLSQDTYVRLMVAGRLPEPQRARAFLAQIARGLAVDLHRRRALEQAYLEALRALPEAVAPSAELQQMTLQVLSHLDQALDTLPDKVRQAFLLSRFEGLTYAQIAKRLEVSVASVRHYMLQAATLCLVTFEALA